MKYINADLLRKEIEKNKNMIDGLFTEGDDSVYDGENDAYNRVLRIIDSLQQEQQEEPDKSLEEEVKKYFQGYWPGTETVEQCNTNLHFTPPAIIRLAHHFAEWQRSQMLKDAVEADVNTYELTPGGSAYVEFVADVPVARFKSNDKVRIIIVKEKK